MAVMTEERIYVLRITQESGKVYRVPGEDNPNPGVPYSTAMAQALQFNDFDDPPQEVSIDRVA